jgi:hypothetical protein
MGYKQLRSFINGIPRSLDLWNVFSEDFEPKGGILSRPEERRRYLRIVKEG